MHGLFPLHIARSLTILVIHNPKRNAMVGPVGLLIPICKLLDMSAIRQDMVELLLHLVIPVSDCVSRHTKKVRAGIRLHGRNLGVTCCSLQCCQ